MSLSTISLKQCIQGLNKAEGFLDTSPEDDHEYFVEGLSEGIVQEETESEHRWYDVRTQVHKMTINGEERFFKTFCYHITGDNCAADMDLDMPTIDSVTEVFPKTITKTIYQ